MNDPGTGPTPDPLFNPAYSQFCYEIPFMPGQNAVHGHPGRADLRLRRRRIQQSGLRLPGCHPAISEVDVDSNIGPWASFAHQLTHHAAYLRAGHGSREQLCYSGPSATTAPFNAKTVDPQVQLRHRGGYGPPWSAWTVVLAEPGGELG